MTNSKPELFYREGENLPPEDELNILRREVSLYRSLLQAAPEGVVIVDFQNSHFRYSNSAFCKMLGYSHKDLLSMGLEDIHPSKNLKRIKEKFSKEDAGEEKVFVGGFPCKRKDGSIFLANINSTTGLFDDEECRICFFEDVTDRIKMEEALRESENRFRELASLLPSIVFECDSSELVTFASHLAFEKLGYSPQDLKDGLNVLDCIVPEDRNRARDNFHKVLQGETFGPTEYVSLARDGRRFPVLVYSSAINKNGKNVGLRGIMIDITERKKMEESLTRTQKLESLGVLAGGIAHDFNNMLVGVLGNISLARDEVDLDSPARVFLRQAEFAADKTKGLTHQLLTFSKGGEPIVESVDISILVRNATDFALRGSRVVGNFNIASDLWYGEIDSNQITQVIQNLVINAVQCMTDGGELQVSCTNCEVKEGDSLPVGEGKFIKIAMSDQGPGISQEIQGKIFDPYYTTKEGSSGLGLAIVHSIVRRHRGGITVDSNPDGGSTFAIYLPAKSPASKKLKKSTEQLVDTCKVLVMDDDAIVLQVASAMLERLGYEIGLAVNADEAMAYFQKAIDEGHPYNLVILDLTIPGGPGGVEVLKKMRSIDPTIKAIVSSGYSNDPVMGDHEKYGFQGVMPKPYQKDGLGVIIKQVLGA